MWMSTDARLRWMAIFLPLALLVGVSAACGSSSSPGSEADTAGRGVAIASQPTGTSAPPGATAAPAPVAAVPVADSEIRAVAAGGGAPLNPADPAAKPEVGGTPVGVGAAGANLILAAFEEVLGGIYESVAPSVVYIRVPSAARSTLQGRKGVPDELLWSAGSGIVWDNLGHIVTNHHVVEEAIDNSLKVTVVFADSTQAKGAVVGGDPHSDLAVIKLEDADVQLHPVTLGDSNAVKVGQLTVAIGAPFGQELTMTSGIVSAVGRNISGQSRFTIPEVIQTDSAINPGNSGGPLLNRLGQVIGINTLIISRSGSFSGVGMAVPINIAKRVVPTLIEDGEFDYPWLGVSIATVTSNYVEELDLTEGTRGTLVIAVVDNSPADRAGLRGSDHTFELDGIEYEAGGDIITAVDDYETPGSSELIAHLLYHNRPRDTVTLTVLRDGHQKEIQVTLGQRPTLP